MVGDNDKAEFIELLRLGLKGEFAAAVLIVADGVAVFAARLKPRKAHPMVITAVDIRLGGACDRLLPQQVGAALAPVENVAVARILVRAPAYRRRGLCVAPKESMI